MILMSLAPVTNRAFLVQHACVCGCVRVGDGCTHAFWTGWTGGACPGASLACRLWKAAAWQNKLDMNCLYERVGFLPARFGFHLLLG